MIVMHLGRYWGASFSSSAPARFVFGLFWAPRPAFTSSPSVLAFTSPPEDPASSPLNAEMYQFTLSMNLQGRLFTKSCLRGYSDNVYNRSDS
jgi:hypothetical protein